MTQKYYLNIGRASDLKNPKERIIYRLLETLPGLLIWATLILMVFLSWQKPHWAAYFIIAFCLYWLLRISHFSFHLVASWRQMKKNLEVDWLARLDKWAKKKKRNGRLPNISDWREIYHLIIFPMHKESLFLIRGTFRALADCEYPKEKMLVVLAVEEKAGESAWKAAKEISKEFGKSFYKFLITCHPQNIKGEIQGKGSNEAWAGRVAKEKIVDKLKIPYENIIVSSFDADTQIFPRYFSCLTYNYLTCPEPLRSSFQPIPIYLNNIWEAPFFSRLVAFSNVFWQALQQQRPEKIVTYSSHSMAFRALVEIDFWQTNVVSEDAGVFWKSFLFYDGDYQIIPLHYPISMDCVMGKNLKETVISQYKQQRRWAWGSEGIPYLFFGFLKNRKISLKQKLRYGLLTIEGFWAWGTNAFLIFFLGWLPLILGGKAFSTTILAYNLPRLVSWLMTLALLGVFVGAFISFRLVSLRPFNLTLTKVFSIFFQWLFLPLTLLVFGALPAIDAQTRLLFGKYLRFQVTEKIRKNPVLLSRAGHVA